MNTLPGSSDKYELQELLGRDGMGEVWKAFDTEARRYVAIKFLHSQAQIDPTFVARFQQDTLAISALNHPNIVQYYDFSLTPSPAARNITAALVMNFVDGGTLADYIQNTSRKGKFPAPGAIVPLFISIAEALAYAHEHEVIHGQLKPTNILLDKRNTARNIMGEPVVTDFGINKLRGIMASATSNPGNWQNGSPVYMSPEQISGSPANERSDIYAFGIILYEVCAGTTPFQGTNPAAIMMQHLNTIPTSPALINPGVPVGLTEVIMRCIAKDPAARFSGAAALVDALKQLDGDETIMASPSQSLPGSSSQPDYSDKSMDMPTIFTRSPYPAGVNTPSQAGISGLSYAQVPPTITSPGMAERGNPAATPYLVGTSQVGSSQPYPMQQSGGQSGPMPPSGPRGPLTPLPSAAIYGQPAQNSVATVTAPPQPVSHTPSRKSGRRTLWIALTALLILLVLGSSLGAYLIFFSKGHSTPPTTSSGPLIVGHAYFVSSGLLFQNATNGITDQLEIHLENIPAPAAGKAYYAWLLNDETMEWSPIYLGQLTVKTGGTVDLPYPGDSAFTNLLATNSRFLITEDDAATTPVAPDSGTDVYYAEFSQIKHPLEGTKLSFSLYDHLRHLLAAESSLAAVGLKGGLDTWLYHNSQKILEWAGSARDATFAGSETFIRNQLTRIMCYLDGASFIQHDLPGANCKDSTVGPGGKIGLLSPFPHSFGFIKHITSHLTDITGLSEATAQQRSLSSEIFVAINAVNQRYTLMREDILQLLHMPTAQWTQPAGLSLRDTITTLANEAFVGTADPHGKITDGVALINYDIQGLATFNVRACTTSDPCIITKQ